MISCEVLINQFILSGRSFFLDKERQYVEITGNGEILINEERFVQINDIAPLVHLRNKLNRDIAKVPEDKKLFGRR